MTAGPGSTVNGIYQYGEDDSEAQFSDLLNRQSTALQTKFADSGWINYTAFTSPWTFYTDGNFSRLAYRKVGNRVFINGGISNPGAASFAVGTMPVGFRPARGMHSVSNTGVAFYVFTTGVIQLSSAVTGSVILNIEYYTD